MVPLQKFAAAGALVLSAAACTPTPSVSQELGARPLNPSSVRSVLAHLQVFGEAAVAQRDGYGQAVVAAFGIMEAFAQEHGWQEAAGVGTFDSVEIFAGQESFWARVLQLNQLPPDTPLVGRGVVAGIEKGVLVAVTPEEYRRLNPEYAGGPDSWTRLLAHEMVHRLHVEILAGNEEAMGPQWFYEGFAVVGAGQSLGEPLEYESARDALAGAKTDGPMAYRRFGAAVRYFSMLSPLRALVERAGRPDFESWLLSLEE